MVSSVMVPEEVRRLFQVLTGEDMTDADEGVLFAVADALEWGAVGVGEVGGLVGELVGKVRTEFSGKAADRFAGGLEGFDGLLSSGQGALGELAVFVRDLARQVRYLKLVTIYGLELLAFEMAWAMAWAGATGGASMAWLAARCAVMRLLLSRWWGQLFMRLAMAAAGGVAFNVVPDLQAQLQMLGEKSSAKWDGKLSEQAAGMGAFSALVSLPLSAVGGLVSNALTKVLVRGLGDEVDEAILEAAARKAVDKHAELYPVSAMARFADVVGDHLDVYAGMSVRGMWSARFGSGIGEALSEGLGELFGEVGYQAATGQEVTWNPFSVTAGVFESVFSGVGNLTGLVMRGKLHPEGPSPYLDDTSRHEGDSDGGGFGAEKTPLPGTGSGSQTGNIPDSPAKDNTFIPSDASDSSDDSDGSQSDRSGGSDSSSVSDVDTVFPDTRSVDSAAVPVSSGDDLVVSGSVPVSAVVVGGTDGKRGAEGGVPGGTPARGVPVVPGSGQDRPGPHAPAYSGEVVGFGSDRSVTPLPPYSPGAGGDQAVPGVHGVEVPRNRPLDVVTSQTSDSTGGTSPAVTPHVSGVPSDTALPKTLASGSGSGPVADPDSGAVFPGHESSPGGWTGQGGPSGVDSVAGRGDWHREDAGAGLPDSAVLPADTGSQAVPSLQQDPALALLAALPVDAVRVLVPAGVVSADVVSGGGLVEFVRGGVAGSAGGPVVLIAEGGAGAGVGVVVSPGQGSALARDVGRDVVALSGRGPRWTVFAADGAAPSPVGGPAGPVPAGKREDLAGLADVSAAVPVSGEQTQSVDAARGKLPDIGAAMTAVGTVASPEPGGDMLVSSAGDAWSEPGGDAQWPVPVLDALPEVWVAHVGGQDAGALLPRIRGHLVVGLTASGGTLTVRELAARIEQLPGWARRPVVLVGSAGSFDLSDAARLRDTLGVDVITADQVVWRAADGRVVTCDLFFVRGGLPTWGERIDGMVGGGARSATAGHWYQLSAVGGTRRLPGADLVAALASSGARARLGTASGSDFRWGVRRVPVILAIQGATDTAEYTAWTRSPDHAAALPDGRKPLLVLGHDDVVISDAEVAKLCGSTGADVLAWVDRGRGPKWMLHRVDGSRPRPVEPPTEVTRTPRPALFGGAVIPSRRSRRLRSRHLICRAPRSSVWM
ncbi:hypothetical protein [Saccharopolyspora spinosa]|uniref:WXG100-like domain-containing protein n=1 Tax=Saccharopolyspora spinosa TaxID=60894 RepID=UPI00376EC8F8